MVSFTLKERIPRKNSRLTNRFHYYLIAQCEINYPPSELRMKPALKLAIDLSRKPNLLDAPLDEAPDLPFSLSAIPRVFPRPSELRLWVTDIS